MFWLIWYLFGNIVMNIWHWIFCEKSVTVRIVQFLPLFNLNEQIPKEWKLLKCRFCAFPHICFQKRKLEWSRSHYVYMFGCMWYKLMSAYIYVSMIKLPVLTNFHNHQSYLLAFKFRFLKWFLILHKILDAHTA